MSGGCPNNSWAPNVKLVIFAKIVAVQGYGNAPPARGHGVAIRL